MGSHSIYDIKNGSLDDTRPDNNDNLQTNGDESTLINNESKKEADVRKLLGDQESRINDTYAEMLANYEADDDNDMLK